jgi:hypothetical protein
VTYVVTVGAAAPYASLQRAIQLACHDVQVVPDNNPGLREAFADAPEVTFVVLHRRSPSTDPGNDEAADAAFVRVRHTPTAMLRQIVSGVTHTFGTTRLFVRQDSIDAKRASLNRKRAQTTTLAGFLRSGKVLPEDTLIKIELPRERSQCGRPG